MSERARGGGGGGARREGGREGGRGASGVREGENLLYIE